MEIPLTYITTGVSGGITHGFCTVIYGLDAEGMFWQYTPKKGWSRIDNPRTGAGKDRPDDPGDETPSHNTL